jgi:hypothetical protein
MKRLVLTAALLVLAFAASAQTAAPAPVEPADPQTTDTASAETSAKHDKADAKKDELAGRNCLQYTGSRLIRADSKGRKCANATGRSYSKEDIDRTGAVDLLDALRRLDPAVH